MTKKLKKEKVIHVETKIAHSQEKDASVTKEVGVIHYKRGYYSTQIKC